MVKREIYNVEQYRKNPWLFVRSFWGINLKWYQIMLLNLAWKGRS